MKTIWLLLTLALCIAVISCGRIYGPVKQVEALIEEKDAVLEEISKKIEQNPSLSGIAEARRVFDAKKDSLKAKRKAIKDAPQGMNVDWQSLLWHSEDHDKAMFDAMREKAVVACNPCPTGVLEGITQLQKDFEEAVK
ncbi:MAG TPA: hypothetical protein VL866_18610 [Pyrinomonadaceae bacterium]|nr:hypothetical protein [Pyrinomonadaceae bacterium]